MLKRVIANGQGYLLLIFMLLGVPDAKADYVHQTLAERSPTIMEWQIEDEQVKLILEIDDADHPIFRHLQQGQAESRFLKASNQIPIRGQVRVLEPRDRKLRFDPNQPNPLDMRGNPIPLPELSPTVTYAEIVYPLTSLPKQLALVPPMKPGDSATATTIGFIVFHNGIPVTNYWYLSQPEPLNLDWDDPWYSRFENPNLKRPHQSSVTSYVYVEPYEVRHEIVIRVQDLAPWLDRNISRDTILQPTDLQQIREQAIQMFSERPQTTIDGEEPAPIVDQLQFLKVDSRGIFQVLPEDQPQAAVSTILGITLAFPNESIPQKIEMEWDLFSDRIQSISTTTTDPAGPFPYTLTPDDNVLVWDNFLKNYQLPTVEYLSAKNRIRIPVGTLLGLAGAIAAGLWLYRQRQKQAFKPWNYLPLVGCLTFGFLSYPFTQVGLGASSILVKPVSETEAELIFAQLLRNIYRAMDFREESDIYDKLAVSLDGDLLTEVYLQNQRSLALENEGGAIAKVEDIEILEVTREDTGERQGEQAFRTRWTAFGTVQHWGHRHQRLNQYDAILSLTPIDGAWKITDIELLEESRLQ